MPLAKALRATEDGHWGWALHKGFFLEVHVWLLTRGHALRSVLNQSSLSFFTEPPLLIAILLLT